MKRRKMLTYTHPYSTNPKSRVFCNNSGIHSKWQINSNTLVHTTDLVGVFIMLVFFRLLSVVFIMFVQCTCIVAVLFSCRATNCCLLLALCNATNSSYFWHFLFNDKCARVCFLFILTISAIEAYIVFGIIKMKTKRHKTYINWRYSFCTNKRVCSNSEFEREPVFQLHRIKW